jgi:hypothetical protein
MDPLNSTALLLRGDTLTWATHVRSPRTRLAGGIALFEGIRGRWTYRLVEPQAMHIHAAQLANGERRLFVRRESDARDGNFQLVQFALSPAYAALDTLYAADGTSRWINRLQPMADGSTAYTWQQAGADETVELHAIGVDARGRMVGRRVLPFDYARHHPLRLRAGAQPWLVLGHIQGNEQGTQHGGTLQLAWVTPTRAWRDASLPHRFVGPNAPLIESPDRFTLTGPMQYPASSGGHLVSLVVSVGVTCPD